MTTYKVQGPDGQVHQFEGPAGASQDQVIAAAQAQFGGSAPETQPNQRAVTARDLAFDAGREAGAEPGALNSVSAAIGQAAQQGTGGLQNYLNAGIRYVAQRAAGVQNPDDIQTDLAYARGHSEGEIEGHPVAGTVGGVLGGIAGAGAAGTALKGTRLARAAAAVPGQKVANVAKAAAAGAAIGGGAALAEGQNLPQAAETAALSGAGGTVAPKVMSYSVSKLQPTAQRAMQTLADNLRESLPTLQATYDNFVKLTGNPPSIAQIMDLKAQGKLRDFAKANPTIAAAAIKAANIGDAPLHEQLAATQFASRPQSAQASLDLRDSRMDEGMNAAHPVTGKTLAETPVDDPQKILLSPHVDLALNPDQTINARLNRTSPTLDRIQNNQATLADVETVRKALRDQQTAFMSPSAGSTHARNPQIAKEFGDIANKVEGLGRRADPTQGAGRQYGALLDQYRSISRYTDAFTHGLNGNPFEAPEGDHLLASALKSKEGAAGYEHGNALHTAQNALDSIAPGSVAQPEGGVAARHLAQGGAAVATGGINSIIHGLRALPVVGDRLPEGVQKVIAKQLFDNNPRVVGQGIRNLTRAGADAKSIRAMAAGFGGAASAKIADYLSSQGQ